MNAKVIKKIKVGSSIFFNKFNDFTSGDNDWICILDKPLFGNEKHLLKKKNDDYLFLYINDSVLKRDLLKYTTDYYQACSFLSPEFIEYINNFGVNFTIDDLKTLRHFFNDVKPKHLYTKYICDAYIKNKGFYLTDEQLKEAYKIYKENKK